MFNNARLVITAATKAQWPQEDMAEFLMCGKSNVGKSSLINAMCNRKNLAYVGQTPGKTRLLNFYEVQEKLRLVDAPGYGYYEKSSGGINNFKRIVDSYIATRCTCKGLLLLISAQKNGLDDDDYMILDLANEYRIPCLIVLTKTDKLSKSQLNVKLRNLANELEIEPTDIFVTSSEKRVGIEDLCDMLKQMSE